MRLLYIYIMHNMQNLPFYNPVLIFVSDLLPFFCDLLSLPFLLCMVILLSHVRFSQQVHSTQSQTLTSILKISYALFLPSSLFARYVCTSLLATEMGKGGRRGEVGGRWSRMFPRQPGTHIRRLTRSHGENPARWSKDSDIETEGRGNHPGKDEERENGCP